MHSPVRVPFGLRSYATDSESGSWCGSELSGFASDSDADSVNRDFHCEADLPGFEAESLDSGVTPDTTPKHTQSKTDSLNKTLVEPKESWSEIDERARRFEEKKPRVKVVKEAPRPVGRSNKANVRVNEIKTASYAEKSENWRSRAPPRRRPDRRRPERRRPRIDPPLKGAVERPYTLPSGPITILRRPTAESQDCPADAEKGKLPGSSELEHLGFVDDSAHLPGLEAKENDQGSNAKVVTTRFGQAYLVENPISDKSEPTVDTPPPRGRQMKDSRHAAIQAMAGLSMGANRDGELPTADSSYDRGYRGSMRGGPRRSRRPRGAPAETTVPRGGRSRANVFIGRRPKLETRHVREEDFLLGE